MFNLLEQLGIDFTTEYSPKWCRFKYKYKIRTGRYDFYFNLDNREQIIEMDGGFHKKDGFNQTKEESKEIDGYKDDLAEEHGIKVIRIECEESESEYIKDNIIQSKLNSLFDLSNVDYLKCHEFACSNRVEEACNYKEHHSLSCTEIALIMKLNRTTIRNYLIKGSILNWCTYDGEEEKMKKNLKLSKKVEVYKDNILLGIFISINELCRKSEEIFKVKFYKQGVSKVCHGGQNLYFGYVFKFVNEIIPSPTETELAITSISTMAS